MGFKILKPEDFSEEILRGILALVRRVAPSLATSDMEEWRREQLQNPDNINVIYEDEDGEVGAFTMAIPHSSAYADPLFLKYDPSFENHDNYYYIEAIESDPKKNHGNKMIKLINTMVREANRRGVTRFSMHARKSNGLSRVVSRVYPAKIIRTVKNWYGFGESFDYIEGELNLLKN